MQSTLRPALAAAAAAMAVLSLAAAAAPATAAPVGPGFLPAAPFRPDVPLPVPGPVGPALPPAPVAAPGIPFPGDEPVAVSRPDVPSNSCNLTVDGTSAWGRCDGTAPQRYRTWVKCTDGMWHGSGSAPWLGDREGARAYCPTGSTAVDATIAQA